MFGFGGPPGLDKSGQNSAKHSRDLPGLYRCSVHLLELVKGIGLAVWITTISYSDKLIALNYLSPAPWAPSPKRRTRSWSSSSSQLRRLFSRSPRLACSPATEQRFESARACWQGLERIECDSGSQTQQSTYRHQPSGYSFASFLRCWRIEQSSEELTFPFAALQLLFSASASGCPLGHCPIGLWVLLVWLATNNGLRNGWNDRHFLTFLLISKLANSVSDDLTLLEVFRLVKLTKKLD